MANEFYNRGATFNPDELADGDALEAEFDAVVRGFDTINTAIDTDRAGYPTQTFHVAPATEATHAPQKAQLDEHINDQGSVHGATSVNTPNKLVKRDSNGDICARNFVGDCSGNANTATNATQHINDQGSVHGATSVNTPDKLVKRDANGDIGARMFIGDLGGKVANTAPVGGSVDLLHGVMGGSDSFRLSIGGNTDAGWVEIATADNGNEPIYVRQYSGDFLTIVRTLALLDGNGNTALPNNLYLYGNLPWVEYGANSNGEYYRYADGTQICTRTISAALQNPTTHAYAASFVAAPAVVVSNDAATLQSASSVSVTPVSFAFFSSTTNYTVKIIAIGRWR